MTISTNVVVVLVFVILTFVIAALILYSVLQNGFISTPPDLYIPMSTYMCDTNDNIAICSGPAFDKKGNTWQIMDKAEFQEPNENGSANRFIEMTITDGKKVYLLQGKGTGQDTPEPDVVGGTWNMSVLNLNNVNAEMTIVDNEQYGISAFINFS